MSTAYSNIKHLQSMLSFLYEPEVTSVFMITDKYWLRLLIAIDSLTVTFSLLGCCFFKKQQSHNLSNTDMVALYLAKAAFSQDLVEDEVVHIDAGQMSHARLRLWAGLFPQSPIGRSL